MAHWRDVAIGADRLVSGTPARACFFLTALFVALFVWRGAPFRVVLVPPEAVFLGHWNRDIADFAVPRAGEYRIVKSAQWALALLREHKIEQYSVSAALARQGEVRVRIMEGGVPIMFKADAPDLLLYKFETLPPDCRLVDEREAMRLARCD
ncbi:MAG: hypothetical protein AB7F08_06405 [Dongiaceae bacterium]